GYVRPLRLIYKFSKSILEYNIPAGGRRISLTSDSIKPLKAAPKTTPTPISTAFPLTVNYRNSWNNPITFGPPSHLFYVEVGQTMTDARVLEGGGVNYHRTGNFRCDIINNGNQLFGVGDCSPFVLHV